MITIFSYENLGQADLGWLKTHYHFSFADYHNPARMGVGPLKVINDDTIAPGTGFDMHPHKDMEIITYVTQGAISHRDSHGNIGKTTAGNVQIMSAGSGIMHAEYNHEPIPTKLFQIWIQPNKSNLHPRWQTHQFPTQQTNQLMLLVDGQGNAPLTIAQEAKIYAGTLNKGCYLQHTIKGNGYLIVIKGAISINNKQMSEGDGAEIKQVSFIELTSEQEAQILLIEVGNTPEE